VLASHACHGGLFNPGDADLVRVGDSVVVANLLTEERGVPICGGRLHGTPRWREAILPHGQLFQGEGTVYFQRFDGTEHPELRALDENLRPTGLTPPTASPIEGYDCKGLTGSTSSSSSGSSSCRWGAAAATRSPEGSSCAGRPRTVRDRRRSSRFVGAPHFGP
jgi:hypothetical protein